MQRPAIRTATLTLLLALSASTILLAGIGVSRWVPAAEGETQYEWVLRDVRINPGHARTSFKGGGSDPDYFPEERFRGKSEEYTVNETSITHNSVDYDYGVMYHEVSFTATFDKPPRVMAPGDKITLEAELTGSGTVNPGAGATGMKFQYFYDGKGRDESMASISSTDFTTDFSVLMEEAPYTNKAGDSFTLSAGLWNCDACQVEWVYESRLAGSSTTGDDEADEGHVQEKDRWVLTDIDIKNADRNPSYNIDHPDKYTPLGNYLTVTSDYRVFVTERSMSVFTYESIDWVDGEARYQIEQSASYAQPPTIMKPGDTVNLSIRAKAAARSREKYPLRENRDVETEAVISAKGIELSGDTEARAGISYDPKLKRGFVDAWIFSLPINKELHPEISDSDTDTAEPSFEVPEIEEDGTIAITASIAGCPTCTVTWVYAPGVDGPLNLGADDIGSEGDRFEDREEDPASCAQRREDLLPQVPYSPSPELLREGYIGMIIAATGSVAHDYCSGGINRSVQAGTFIHVGDSIYTGDRGLVRIMLFDQSLDGKRGPTTFGLGSNSELELSDFIVDFKQQWRKTNWELFKGAVREFSRGWGGNSSASFRTGVTICGSRGSDVVVTYDPDEERVNAYVYEGEMEVTNDAGDMGIDLAAGEQLQVEDYEAGEVEPLSGSEWDTLLEDQDLYVNPTLWVDEYTAILLTAREDTPVQEAVVQTGDSQSYVMPALVAAVAIVSALGATLFLVVKKRKQNV